MVTLARLARLARVARLAALSSSVAGAAVLASPAAHAGVTAPLSSLSSMPTPTLLKAPEAPTAIPGLVLQSKDGPRDTRWHDLTAATARGYCIQSSEGGLTWSSTRGSSSRGTAEDFDLVHFVEKDEKVTLERTRVHFDPPSGSLTAMSRSAVELKEVARTAAGIVVWAYRDRKDVVVMARHVERGMESRRVSSDVNQPFMSSDGCPYGGARLDARRPELGAAAQLAGNLPAHGKGKERVVPRFIVDASVSRVSRDPEPMLAVRVRVHD
jgi:hypothetical protein